MHKTLLCVVVLLCACQAVEPRQFNSARAERVREIMDMCEEATAQLAFILPPAEVRWHFQNCLAQNNATI